MELYCDNCETTYTEDDVMLMTMDEEETIVENRECYNCGADLVEVA